MEFKGGIDIQGVQPELVVGLIIAESIYAQHGVDLVVTACLNGQHKPTSLHYKGLAADLRTHNIPNQHLRSTIYATLRSALGSQWDVLLEGSGTPNEHIHMEFDPK